MTQATGHLMNSSMTIALAIGDPNGIGPEIAVKAAAQRAREMAEAGAVAPQRDPAYASAGD